MSAAATLAPHLPPPSQSQLLSLANASSTGLLSKKSSESPRSVSSKTSAPAPSAPSAPSAVHQAAVQQREGPSEVTMKSPPSQTLPIAHEDRKLTSPVPMKLPDAAQPAAMSLKEPLVSPPLAQQALITRNTSTSPNDRKNSINNENVSNTASEQAPAQLALLLSQALAEADALRRDLTSEKKRVARAERLLAALQAPSSPNSASTSTDARNSDGRLHESAAKAILDAETRAEKAERGRDDAIHALASLTASFAELERYESACVLRASDARGAYSRLLTSLSTAHPLPQPASNNSPRDEPRLNLPRVLAPFPSLPPVAHLPGPSFSLAPPSAPPQSSRYGRSLQTHSTFSSTQSPIDARQANAFDSLALPPPPAATGLASINTSLPVKRSHSHRSRAEEAEYEDQKRRRLTHEVDVDMAGPDVNSVYARTSSRHYQSGPPSAQPLLGHPSVLPPLGSGLSSPSRVDRTSSVQYAYSPASGPSYQREGISPYGPPPSAGSRYLMYDDREREYINRDRDAASGIVRIDARELVREAKARERRGRERESFVRLPQSESHLHPQSQEGLHVGSRARGRSASRSSSRSKSSLSLDEMLLETATDGVRGRPSPPEQHASGPGGMRQAQNFGVPPSVNGVSPPLTAAPPPASHPMSKAPSTHAPATNGVGRKSSIPASQLMTLGPSGTIVSGGGSEAPGAAGSVDPAVRFPGLRTCRQCHQPGRYKDGKCVEKWGPGPQGPGTVCDRCRKKMKRVERRGTLDSSASLRGNHSQSQSQKVSQPTLSLAPSQSSYSQSYSQSQSQSGRTRAPPARTDTLIVDNEKHQSDPNQGRSPGHNSSSYHGPVPPASAAARHPSLASPAHYVTPHSQSHHQHHAQPRRAPTPPFITAIPSREQHGHRAEAARHADSNSRRTGAGAESDDNLLEDEEREARSGDRSAAGARYAHSESYARQPLGERDERDELADDADADADADADVDGSGVGSADAEAEDAEIMDAVDATMKVEE
ncbi:hypothetical protein ACEPAG_5865 [Sanghuangporus baumii]